MANSAFDLFGETQSAYAHNGDDRMLADLGLKTSGFKREWTDLGTVVLHEASVDERFGPIPATEIRVEVVAMPAMFWRFTILRPRDEIEELEGEDWRAVYEPREKLVINTGSGSFSEYWSVANMVAEHMIYMNGPEEEGP